MTNRFLSQNKATIINKRALSLFSLSALAQSRVYVEIEQDGQIVDTYNLPLVKEDKETGEQSHITQLTYPQDYRIQSEGPWKVLSSISMLKRQ